MMVYICKTCCATLHRSRDSRKLQCDDCRSSVKICNLDPLQTADRGIPESERKEVMEVII